jgi:lipoprotein NlpD
VLKLEPVHTDKGWLWPVSGQIVRQFSPQNELSKGIDIAARIGTSIKSSRSGSVVYAGNGLKGYGNLIIVRHDDVYLSAYAHNRKILVKEGHLVKQGQRIAELGSSGTQSPKLHFEIRKHGKPINPLTLLPNNNSVD